MSLKIDIVEFMQYWRIVPIGYVPTYNAIVRNIKRNGNCYAYYDGFKLTIPVIFITKAA